MLLDRSDQNAPNQASRFTYHVRILKEEYLQEKGLTETSKEVRRSIYSQAQRVLLEKHIPVAPIYAYVTQALVSKRVQNYPINTMQRRKFKDVKLIK